LRRAVNSVQNGFGFGQTNAPDETKKFNHQFNRDWQEFRLVFSVADELPKRYLTTYLPFAKT